MPIAFKVFQRSGSNLGHCSDISVGSGDCHGVVRSIQLFPGLLPTEWVNLDVFLQVEADFKGFLVNQMVMSSQACCAHAKIRQEETSAG